MIRTLLLIALSAVAPGTAAIHGRIAAVNADELLVKQSDGTSRALRLQPGYTRIHVLGRPAKVDALQPGESVTATWVSGHGEPVARDVTATP